MTIEVVLPRLNSYNKKLPGNRAAQFQIRLQNRRNPPSPPGSPWPP